MNIYRTWGVLLIGVAGYGLVGFSGPSAAEPEAAKGPLIVINSGGKEQKLKTWKFVAGTRRLSWLAPAKDEKKDEDKKDAAPKKGKAPALKAAVGPEALVLREENSTDFLEGIETLILLDTIRAINFDNEQKTVTVRVATGEKDDATVELTGTTKYVGSNKISLEAEADLGDLGVAEVKFQGGVARGGIRGLVFPAPKPAAAPTGRPAAITANEKAKEKTVHKGADVQALYRLADGSRKLSPTLFFKKTLKIDIAKLQKVMLLNDKDPSEIEWQVTLKDGQEVTLTILANVMLDGEKAVLEGLVARVPAGYKFFYPHTIGEIQFDEVKDEPKPEAKE